MGDEEKKDPPPPSLSKPEAGPPPPSLSKPEPTPDLPPASRAAAPPVIQKASEKPEGSQAPAVEPGQAHGELAEINPRLIAGLIDILVAAGITLVATWILPDMLERIGSLLGFAYIVTRDSLPFLNGQSIGKTALKLKAVKSAGGSLENDWQTAIVRNVALIVPFFGLVEAIVLFSRDNKPEKGRRLGDDWAKTKVVVWRPDEASSPEAKSIGDEGEH